MWEMKGRWREACGDRPPGPPVARQGRGHGGGGVLGRARRRDRGLCFAVLGVVVGQFLPSGHHPSRLLHRLFLTFHGSRRRRAA
jgi:hypothetical protein